jgi:gag-polyprotein putative aspartyl protease
MAQLRFPTTRTGLIVRVWIGLSGRETMVLLAAGLPIPPPIQGLAFLDTGSDVTAISARCLQSLGIAPTMSTSTTTAGGPVQVRLFEVTLSITELTYSTTAWLTEPDLLVMELPASLPGGDGLIGLDVLLSCKLLVDGPAGHFMLDF